MYFFSSEPGKLEFSKPSYIVKESAASARLIVNRVNGADGEVKVAWHTSDMSAKSNVHYVGGQGTVTFTHGETSKLVEVGIIGTQVSQLCPSLSICLRYYLPFLFFLKHVCGTVSLNHFLSPLLWQTITTTI